jgi:hypothetical protein
MIFRPRLIAFEVQISQRLPRFVPSGCRATSVITDGSFLGKNRDVGHIAARARQALGQT